MKTTPGDRRAPRKERKGPCRREEWSPPASGQQHPPRNHPALRHWGLSFPAEGKLLIRCSRDKQTQGKRMGDRNTGICNVIHLQPQTRIKSLLPSDRILSTAHAPDCRRRPLPRMRCRETGAHVLAARGVLRDTPPPPGRASTCCAMNGSGGEARGGSSPRVPARCQGLSPHLLLPQQDTRAHLLGALIPGTPSFLDLLKRCF